MAISCPVRWSFPSYPGFKLFQYAAGTTTKQDTFTTSALAVANANPLSADANGLLAAMYLDPAKSYKFVLAPSTDSDPPTNAIFTQDNVTEQLVNTLTILSKTADYTVVASDGDDAVILVDASLGNVTITLYTAVGNSGKKVRIKKTDSGTNTVTVDPNGTETIDGATTHVLQNKDDAIGVSSDGSNWVIFAAHNPRTTVLSKSADYTVLATDGRDVTILMSASGAARTVNLYAASGNKGKRVTVKKTDSSTNAVTIDGSGAETIDGATTLALSAQYNFAILECDGSNWQVLSKLNPSLSAVRVYTANDTWSKPGGLHSVVVWVVGGGGGGGGAPAPAGGQASAGGGAGGGGGSMKRIVAASLGATETVTVGAGGSGSSGANGTAGGTSSFGAHLSATGGALGSAGTAGTPPSITGASGVGGAGSSGDLNLTGSGGSYGVTATSTSSLGGSGGSSIMGGGARAAANEVGVAGGNYGGGGGGAASTDGAGARAGGNGASGVVIVYEYTH